MTYQQLFNETLSKMRLVTGAALQDHEPLMRSLAKIMYDFSDGLRDNDLLKGQDKNGNKDEKYSL